MQSRCKQFTHAHARLQTLRFRWKEVGGQHTDLRQLFSIVGLNVLNRLPMLTEDVDADNRFVELGVGGCNCFVVTVLSVRQCVEALRVRERAKERKT